MILRFQLPRSWADFVARVGRAGRRELNAAAANAARILVRSHLAREAQARHATARRLGADPTGHLEKAARATTFSATPEEGVVSIPGAGVVRAFRDVEIVPVRAKALTIPVHAAAYGKKAAELGRRGWNLFRPKGRDVLMGSPDGKNPVSLYALRKRVSQKQDRSLLPSDEQIARASANAMAAALARVARRAS